MEKQKKSESTGHFIFENSQGYTVRTFQSDATQLTVIYNESTRRIETCVSKEELENAGISFQVLAEVASKDVKKQPVALGSAGYLKWVSEVKGFSPEAEMIPESPEQTKKIWTWSAVSQISFVSLILIFGALTKSNSEKPQNVAVIPQEVVNQMIAKENSENLAQQKMQTAEQKIQPKKSHASVKEQTAATHKEKIIVAPSETKLAKNHHYSAHHNASHLPSGKGVAKSSPFFANSDSKLNQMGALAALNNTGKTVGYGHGGRGGLNLNAVGTEPGSGAGGKGYGGFGNNGGGGHGRGGLGTGTGQGLTNSMYGKGLVAAPFGDGSPAPGAGGYGTLGKAGGGEAGAGYGSRTMVGSSKGYKQLGWAGGNGGTGKGSGTISLGGDDDDFTAVGGLDKDQIADVINRHMGQIVYCYEQGLQTAPSLSGRVAVRFLIGGHGRVETSEVAHSSLKSSKVESCITRSVAGWKFPQPQANVSVRVTYPFVLRRVSQR
jgi:outer membrane biosynthesis protein TonB